MSDDRDKTALAADFLAAIRAEPEDDAPRLIFADWLDENGEPERAEFVRLQIELANIRCDSCKGKGSYSLHTAGGYGMRDIPCDECTSKSLRRRERELLTNSLGLWFLRGSGSLTWATALTQEEFDRPREAYNPCQLVERGFVSALNADFDTLYGGECERCEEYRQRRRYDPTIGNPGHKCKECHGPGILPQLVRAECAAVERVVVSDKRPMQGGGGWFWGGAVGQSVNHPNYLPMGPLIDEDERKGVGQIWQATRSGKTPIIYRSESAAFAALSDALLKWAWSQT